MCPRSRAALETNGAPDDCLPLANLIGSESFQCLDKHRGGTMYKDKNGDKASNSITRFWGCLHLLAGS